MSSAVHLRAVVIAKMRYVCSVQKRTTGWFVLLVHLALTPIQQPRQMISFGLIWSSSRFSRAHHSSV